MAHAEHWHQKYKKQIYERIYSYMYSYGYVERACSQLGSWHSLHFAICIICHASYCVAIFFFKAWVWDFYVLGLSVFGCDGSELSFWCILSHCQDVRVAAHHAVLWNMLPHHIYIYIFNVYVLVMYVFVFAIAYVSPVCYISHFLCFELGLFKRFCLFVLLISMVDILGPTQHPTHLGKNNLHQPEHLLK